MESLTELYRIGRGPTSSHTIAPTRAAKLFLGENPEAACGAINALSLANFLTYTRKISFDMVIKTMYETGCDLFSKYRETSEGGLAKTYFE